VIKGPADWIVDLVPGHVQIVEEVGTSSDTLETGHTEDGVFLSLRNPPVVP